MTDYHAERARRNSESSNKAEHHREPWDREEVEFLLAFWPHGDDLREEHEVAAALGRTIEACRQRRYEVLWGKAKVVEHKESYTITTVTRVTVDKSTRYIGAGDEPGDQWWSPEYYTNEK